MTVTKKSQKLTDICLKNKYQCWFFYIKQYTKLKLKKY